MQLMRQSGCQQLGIVGLISVVCESEKKLLWESGKDLPLRNKKMQVATQDHSSLEEVSKKFCPPEAGAPDF
jgi:hypothetical protein